MKTTINTREVKSANYDELRAMAEKKLNKIGKFFRSEDALANVTFKEVKNQKTVEITISYGGTFFRSEIKDSTYRSALDTAEENIERQIRKYKTRLEKRFKGKGLASVYLPPEETVAPVEEDTGEFEIRQKAFTIKPMSAEEAILQMNLLGHSFFMYIDQETGKSCVVYKRHDDTYGQIIPE